MGVRAYLLDTHTLLWLIFAPERVPAALRSVLADPDVTVFASAASAMEIATKTRLGKLPDEYMPLVQAWGARLSDLQFTSLPITHEHALLAGTLLWEHRDPFDRLLAAQAIIENLTLATRDEALADFREIGTVWAR